MTDLRKYAGSNLRIASLRKRLWIERAGAAGTTWQTPCDFFIVDEIGPLELLHGAGWVNAIETLRQTRFRLGLVAIRPE